MTSLFRRSMPALVGAALVASVLAPPTAIAADEGITVTDAWARATAPSAPNGAAYMTITNTSGADDRLVAASADVAERVELHTHIRDGDIMRMREVDDLTVLTGTTTELAPGGLHIMLIGLYEPLQEGETFPLGLTFEVAGGMMVDVVVLPPGAMGREGYILEGE